MQPSSDHTSGSSTALRRWGPLVALAVGAAALAGVALVAGGDDGEGGAAPDAGGGEVVRPEGAISWTMAQEQGLDVTFPDTCDPELGRVALPYYFAPECYADAEAVTTPGTRGVTDDTVKVVVYLAQDDDPVLSFITSAIANDDTNAEAMDTYRGYVEMFNEYAQTYGRTVELEFLVGSGTVTDEVSARADAVRAIEEMGAFAVWGGPQLANAWTEEIHARGAICLACPSIADPAPYVLTVNASADQIRTHLVEYVEKKLAGRPAIRAGDPALRERERVFGHLYLDTGSEEARDLAQAMRDELAAAGADPAEQVAYDLDPATLQEQAGSVIARFKAAGVTTVLLYPADPVAAKTFTEVATQQQWFPEWVLGGSALLDTAAFARTYDQQQWANAFGISSSGVRTARDASAAHRLYQWYVGREAEADESAGVIYPQPSLFFAGLQAAGPDLTPRSFRDGLFTAATRSGAVTQPSISFGDRGIWPDTDYYGIDDFTEVWWDPEVTGEDEVGREGAGLYRYVDGGRRYLPGEWTSDLRVFDPAGSATRLDEPPEAERPKSYPAPDR